VRLVTGKGDKRERWVQRRDSRMSSEGQMIWNIKIDWEDHPFIASRITYWWVHDSPDLASCHYDSHSLEQHPLLMSQVSSSHFSIISYFSPWWVTVFHFITHFLSNFIIWFVMLFQEWTGWDWSRSDDTIQNAVIRLLSLDPCWKRARIWSDASEQDSHDSD